MFMWSAGAFPKAGSTQAGAEALDLLVLQRELIVPVDQLRAEPAPAGPVALLSNRADFVIQRLE